MGHCDIKSTMVYLIGIRSKDAPTGVTMANCPALSPDITRTISWLLGCEVAQRGSVRSRMAKFTCTREDVRHALKSDLQALENIGYPADIIFDCVALFLEHQDEYLDALKALSDTFLTDTHVAPVIHSVRYRVKDPIHLAQKLAKKALDPKKPRRVRPETLFSFPDGITDLGGLRLLHLYKTDWVKIHGYIMTGGYGESFTKPIESLAYLRQDENSSPFKSLRDDLKFVDVRLHPNNYSSLHYLVRPQGADRSYLCFEIQVRTLFEEGWGEIDHQWSYPSSDDATELVKSQLRILNKAASSANDIAEALGKLNDIPTFIPWHLEQRLEKASDTVYCATPNLKWAVDNSKRIISHLKSCKVNYVYWTMDWNPEAKHNQKVLQSRLAESGLEERVEFRHIPPLVGNMALFSDLLLLKSVSDPWVTASATHRGEQVPQDIAIQAAPAQKNLREEDHLDILITDAKTVGKIADFFKFLEDKCS
jgi:ppGpp synthetase/RelA/SpoT-type nucleotidyltranferase